MIKKSCSGLQSGSGVMFNIINKLSEEIKIRFFPNFLLVILGSRYKAMRIRASSKNSRLMSISLNIIIYVPQILKSLGISLLSLRIYT